MQFISQSLAGKNSMNVEGTNLCFNVSKFKISEHQRFEKGVLEHQSKSNEDNLSALIFRKKDVLRRAFEAAELDSDGWVSIETWAAIMMAVTKLKIRWIVMFPVLVPSEDIVSKDEFDGINFYVFLEKFSSSTSRKDFKVENAILSDPECTVEALYSQHRKLDTIFQFFDPIDTGYITKETFYNGCKVLNKVLPWGVSINDTEEIFDLFDITGDDKVSVNEFYEIFRITERMTCKNFMRSKRSWDSSPDELLRLRDKGISCDSARESSKSSKIVYEASEVRNDGPGVL